MKAAVGRKMGRCIPRKSPSTILAASKSKEVHSLRISVRSAASTPILYSAATAPPSPAPKKKSPNCHLFLFLLRNCTNFTLLATRGGLGGNHKRLAPSLSSLSLHRRGPCAGGRARPRLAAQSPNPVRNPHASLTGRARSSSAQPSGHPASPRPLGGTDRSPQPPRSWVRTG